jgi:hypothetical protein
MALNDKVNNCSDHNWKHCRKEFRMLNIKNELAQLDQLDKQLSPSASLNEENSNTTKSARLASLNRYLNLIKEARRRKQKQEEEEKELAKAFLNKQYSFHILPYTNHSEQKRQTQIAICILSLVVLALFAFSMIDFRLVGKVIGRVAKKNETASIRHNFR